MAKPPTLPDSDGLKRSILDTFEEHRKAIIGGAILVGVLVIGVILYVVMSKQRSAEEWHDLQQAATSGSFASDRVLEDLVDRGGSDVRANALLSLAAAQYDQENYEEAIRTLETFEEEFGDSYLGTLDSPTKYSLPQEILRRAKSQLEWGQKYRFETPTADPSRLALVETTKGAFWIAFYPDYAPKHIESFVSHAKAGDYNGTQVYAISPTHLDMGGAATRDDDPANDKTPELTGLLESEKGRFWLEQSRGRVSSVAWPEGESPTRFTVVVSPTGAPNLNKRQTIFGEVLRDRGTGLTAVDAIRNVVTYGTSTSEADRTPEMTALADHPIEAVVIERVSIWSNDAIEDGHSWDTSEVTPPKAEDAVPPATDPEKTEPEKTDPEKTEQPTKDGAEGD